VKPEITGLTFLQAQQTVILCQPHIGEKKFHLRSFKNNELIIQSRNRLKQKNSRIFMYPNH